MKDLIVNAVEKNKQLILQAERDIWAMPETGYFEYKTNKYMADAFEKLGYKLIRAKDITGFYTVLDTGKVGPTVLVLAELDALICSAHPEADKETGNVHVCGHHAQCAAILGLAAALKEKGVTDSLCGKIKLCVVPAEEGIEIEKRNEMKKQGVIKFDSGKSEFIYRRYFDDVDIAFMVHTHISKNGEKFCLGTGSNGVIRKKTVFKGVAAHAGEAPEKGINALNTAMVAITTINSLRETFKDEDRIRVHSIITKGGEAVNAVPEKVIMESYVRAASVNALKEANQKINRAISAVAVAFGARVEIIDIPGSEALINDANLNAVAKEVVENLFGADKLSYKEWLASSTDMGDISTLFPTIHPYACGATGTLHGKDFYLSDPIVACVENAQFQLGILIELLRDNAKKAKKIIKEYQPVFKSVDEYLSHKQSMDLEKETVQYNADGTITIDFIG